MKLKPFKNNADNIVLNPEIREALGVAGLDREVRAPKDRNKIDEIREVFESHGCGIHEAAEQISYLMSRADAEPVRIRAAELALKVQGVFNEMDERQIPEININIVGNAGQTIVQLLMPKTN